MPDRRIAEAMAQDETEFDKLLKEAREWEARDRARQRPLAMNDDGGGDAFPPASRAPLVTPGELAKKVAADLGANLESPGKTQASSSETPKPAESIRDALKAAIQQAQAGKAETLKPGAIRIAVKTAMKDARAQSQATRVRRKGGWGWIWALILLYFVFRHFVR